MPKDSRANDLFHWQITATATASNAAGLAAAATGGREISRSNATREVFLRDRDGHAMLAHDAR